MTWEEFKHFKPQGETYGLLGYPLGHTMSPSLHAMLFDAYGKKASYLALEIPPEHLKEAFQLASHQLQGINVTIPYKKAVLPFLDEVDEKAKNLNSVNTINFQNGKSVGYNTDILGFAESLKRDQIKLKNQKVLLIGYGGAATVMGLHCVLEGAELFITGRNLEKTNKLRRQLAEIAPNAKIQSVSIKKIPKDIQILIQGTPLGMYPREKDCPISRIPKSVHYIFDAIYNPPLTKLLKLGKWQHRQIRNGLYMLVMQAVKAEEIWTGQKLDVEVPQDVLKQLYGKMAMKRLRDVYGKKNLVLCGYMGSGKTTIGRKLAKIIGCPFYDTDQYLEKMEQKKIKEIFQENGEVAFRKLETQYIKELMKQEGAVIALGGGSVLTDENIRAVKTTGLVIYLNTPWPRIVKNLASDQDTRPLIPSEEQGKEKQMLALYRVRKPFYQKAADITVSSPSIVKTIDQILKRI